MLVLFLWPRPRPRCSEISRFGDKGLAAEIGVPFFEASLADLRRGVTEHFLSLAAAHVPGVGMSATHTSSGVVFLFFLPFVFLK